MTVKDLIKKLVEMPMDATVLIGQQQEENGDFITKKPSMVVDYEDNTVGIVSYVGRDEVPAKTENN